MTVEFHIDPELVGVTLGKKGSRIKAIEAETGVTNINVSESGCFHIFGKRN